MPAPPTPEELAFAAAKLAESALESAAHNDHALRTFAHDWFPDHDAIDWREMAKTFKRELTRHRLLIANRRHRLTVEGAMVDPSPSAVRAREATSRGQD